MVWGGDGSAGLEVNAGPMNCRVRRVPDPNPCSRNDPQNLAQPTRSPSPQPAPNVAQGSSTTRILPASRTSTVPLRPLGSDHS